MRRRFREVTRETAHRFYYTVFGYDYFICYTWRDEADPNGLYRKGCGRTYAENLYKKLTEQELICFLDSEEFLLGQKWWSAARLALRASSRMILVATPAITDSKAAMDEIRFFAECLDREVVPISFSGCNLKQEETILTKIVNHQILHLGESNQTLLDGPSDSVIEDLYSTGKRGRQRVLRMRLLFATIATLSLLLVASVISGAFATMFLKETREQLAVSYLRKGAEATASYDASLAALYFAKAREVAPGDSPILPVINRHLGHAIKNSGIVLDEFYSDESHGIETAANESVKVSTKGNRNIGFFGLVSDAHTDLEIARLPHQDSLFGISLDNRGKTIATASADRTVRLWDSKEYSQCNSTLYHHEAAHLGGFSDKEDELYTMVYVSSKATNRYRKWRIQRDESEIQLSLSTDERLRDVSRSPCGMRFIIVGTSGIYLLDLNSGKFVQLVTRALTPGAVRAKAESSPVFVRFSSCSKTAVIGNIGHNARVWDLETATPIHDLVGVNDCCVLSHDSLVYLTASGLFSLTLDREREAQLLYSGGEMNRLSLSPDRATLVAYSRQNANSKFVAYRLSNRVCETFREDGKGRGPGIGITNVSWSSDSRRFVTSNLSGNVVIWDSKTMSKRRTISESDSVNAAYFHPRRDAVLVCCANKAARLRSASNGEMLLPEFPHDEMVASASISDCGQFAWTLDGMRVVKFWELEYGTLIGKKKFSHGNPTSISHHTDKILLTGEGCLRVWDIGALKLDQGSLELELKHLACRRLNESGGVELLTTAELDEMWKVVKDRSVFRESLKK